MLKSKIRKKILKIREKNNNKNIYIKFNFFFNFLKKITNLKKKIIGGYYPVNFEIDDINILKEFEKRNIKLALPMIKKNYKMNFVQYSLNDPLVINKYGIPEPDQNKLVHPNILLVPLVAFDHKKFRLGYGGGYYDRYVSKMKDKKLFITIGLAFDFQKVKRLTVNQFDKKMDIIATNKKIYK